MIYILLAFVLLFSVFHCLFGNKPPKQVYILSVITLIFIGGFRYFVGVDYEAYKIMYESENDASNYLYYIEPAWSILYTMIHSIKGTYVLWFLITNAITVTLMVYGMRNQSPFLFLSLIFYVSSSLYTESFNAVRQFLAMAIVFAGIPLIFRKKELIFLLLIILAMCFHYSAGIALLFFPLRKRYNFTLMIAILIFTAIFGDRIMNNYLIPVTESFGAFFSTVINSKRDYSLDATALDTMINSGVKKVMYNTQALIMLYFAKKWNDKRIFYLNSFFLSVIIYNIFRGFMEYLRFSQYFLMSGLILYPMAVEKVKGNKEKWVLLMFFVIAFFIFLLKDSSVVNYQMRFGLFE